ncbi:ATP-dependent helicase [Clostridium botulinum]|uniref:ATP-dependent helicase n=1 Tax=Clostridium botulinum TaxID=1491 RepID=UPI0019686AA9|nr:ATP-dependent helicase [Clostridium botulinum]MBN1076067.1 ATP-dependent helicase [Clostridium botulinum]
MKFNKEQLEVINHKDGAMAVIAGAGSGKSTVLVERVNELIKEGVDSDEILVVTFTDNSSKDLKTKFKKKKIDGITTGTFHAISKRILISEGIDTSKQLACYQIENELKKIDENAKVKDIMSFIGYQKNYGIGVNDDFIDKESDYTENELRDFFKCYESFKTKQHALDFEDWLILTVDILKKNPNKYSFKYILVDEHQDSNLLQNEMIQLLCPSGNVFCVFDYRQAIYTFRGGNPEYCMNFKEYYPNAKIINLSMNYRSTKNIVDNSNNFISKYYGDYEFYKDSVANNNKNGGVEVVANFDKDEEAKNIVTKIKQDLSNGIKPNDIAIIYRNNSNSFNIENELKQNDISYFISSTDGNFFNRKEISCLMCMLRLIDNPHDNVAYDTVFNTRTYPFSFIPNTIRNRIRELSAKKNISLFDASELVTVDKPYQRKNLDIFKNIVSDLIIQHKRGIKLSSIVDNILTLIRMNDFIEDKYEGEQLDERLESITAFKSFIRDNTLESFLKFVYGSNKSQKKCTKDDIQLMTIHKSKGLEFKNVYLIGIQDGKFPSEKAPIDEEARLMYVAITRPKENLTLSQIYDENRFIEEYLN